MQPLALYIPQKRLCPGDIILVSGRSIVSRIIKARHPRVFKHNPLWFTAGVVNHTAIVAQDKGKLVLVEAIAEGIVISDVQKYCEPDPNEVIGVALMRCEGADLNVAAKLSEEALKYVGRPYDYPGLLSFMLLIILHKLGFKVQNPIHLRKAWFCSEIVAQIYLAVMGIELKKGARPQSVSPQDLLVSPSLRRMY